MARVGVAQPMGRETAWQACALGRSLEHVIHGTIGGRTAGGVRKDGGVVAGVAAQSEERVAGALAENVQLHFAVIAADDPTPGLGDELGNAQAA
jgi:hypothetical protein